MTLLATVGILSLAVPAPFPPAQAAAAEAPGGKPALKLPIDLRLADLSGKKTRVDFAASPLTLVNFWATWCMPCREEMPEIVKLLAAHRERGFRAIGVAMESGEASEIKAFLEENKGLGVTYPIFVGDDDVAERFGGIEVVPTTYLVNRRGEVVKRYFGVSPEFSRRVGSDIEQALHAQQP